ncbi:MAG: DUF3168 domain-containing protein [Rhodobacteraceae bacterium]|nr:DUF3168 domain-containing protein [Paracoccaceae bacterium]
MEETFRSLLLNSGPVSSVVGSRVNFGAHPQGAPLPAIVLNTVSDVNEHHLNAPETLSQARVQVDCYADSYGGAKLLSRAVRSALDGEKTAFQGVFFENSRDGREGGTNEADRPFRVSVDFLVVYNIT